MNKKNARRCDVALLVDEETGEYARDGRFIPEDDDVEEKVLRALRRSYARVEVVPFTRDVKATVRWLRRLDPRIVMNLTEWLDGDRTQDAAIARVLDRMGVTYTGPGPRGLGLARDKARSKRIAAKTGIAVPRHFVVERNAGLNGRRVTFPLLVKPQFGDGSEGIHASSVAGDIPELRERIRLVHAWHRQPAVCEEFIQGNDVYVALLGNEPRVLQPVELVVRSRHPAAPRFATYRLKNDPRYRARWGAHYRPARLEASTRRSLEEASRKLFHALGLRDYARLDFRMTEEGRFYFIEANPNPDLDPYALNRSGCFAGVPYVRLLRTIVESARERQRRES